MILGILLWNILSIKDILYYQSNRYQKDRYLDSMNLYLYDCIHIILLIIIIILLYQFDLNHIYTLCILGLLPSTYIKIKEYIKQLVITNRIKRFIVGIILFDILLIFLSSYLYLIIIILLTCMIYFHHAFLYIFITIYHPLENKIRENYVLKAKKKLSKYNGTIIGITGSYGKTSIKNLVYDVLSMKYFCLKTKASYNNSMGITKTILEELTYQDIFICEMGADHLHEIEDLCNFVNPNIGILTSIGPQHLSTFKSIENILYEKLKILECLDSNGVGFYNYDNFYLFHHDFNLRCKLISIGIHNIGDIQAINISCNQEGSSFDVMIDHEIVHFKTMLLGEHNILNCLFAIALGLHFEIDISLIQLAISSSRPTEHRLELKKFYKGICIDNAYNSNPSSAKSALDVLKMMPKRHIIITPGFIDLGNNHEYYSEQFGRQMSFCDMIILIGSCKDILKGLKIENYNQDNIYQVNSMKEALKLASILIQENDTLLIENDIPQNLIK